MSLPQTPCPFYKVCPTKILYDPEKCMDRAVLECPFFQEYLRESLLFLYNRMEEGEELSIPAFTIKKEKDGLRVIRQ